MSSRTASRPDAVLPEAAPSIEQRSIDYIPLAERHGRPWHITPVWVMCTANFAMLPLGAIGILGGLSLLWSLVAIVIGALFGTFFAAFHSSQGPQLGLPQMIQSRPQYGYYGAVLIYVIAIASFIGFSVFGLILFGQATELVLGIPAKVGMIAGTALAVFIAVVGYDLVHRFARWAAAVFVLVFLVLVIATPFALSLPAGVMTRGGFSMTIFMLQFASVAAATIAWAPYVSDYTRYLPYLGLKQAFFGTYLGMTVSAIWVAGIAAPIAAAFPKLDILEAFHRAGDAVFPGFGTMVLAVAGIGTILLVTMDSYGSALTSISIVDTFRPIRPTAALRATLTVAMGTISLLIAMAASGSFLTDYGNFLTVLLYALAPWTATNLVDFFFVRRGRYSVREIFNPRGMYGLLNWRGYTAYVLAMCAMTPFMMTAWWEGPIAKSLGYDIAPYVGLVASGLIYLVLARSMDLASERRQIDQADAGLEPETTP